MDNIKPLEYKIKNKGREVGTVSIEPAVAELGKNTVEITYIKFVKGEIHIELGIKTINSIWKLYSNVTRIVVCPTSLSEMFWSRLGFQKLNNDFWFISKMR